MIAKVMGASGAKGAWVCALTICLSVCGAESRVKEFVKLWPGEAAKSNCCLAINFNFG